MECSFVLTEVDGPATGRVAGQRPGGSRVKQGQSRTGATQRHSTSERRNRCEYVRSAGGRGGREFLSLNRGGNVAVVMDDMRRHHHGHGAEEVGIASVRREGAIMLPHRA